MTQRYSRRRFLAAAGGAGAALPFPGCGAHLSLLSLQGITMNITLWIIASVLAFAFLAGGLMKLTQPKPKLVASGQPWTEDFSDSAGKGIGALAVPGALGLGLPA